MVTYQYNANKNIIYAQPPSILTTDQALNHFQNLLKDQSIQKGAIEIVTFAKLKDIQFNYTGSLRMRTLYKQVIDQLELKETIFEVDSELSYGMARMIIMVFEPLQFPMKIKRS